MAFPTNTYTGTNLANLIPTVWSSKIQDFYKQKTVASNFFEDLSSELTAGGKVIQYPILTEMSANPKSNATAVTLNNATYDKVTLTVDSWYEVSFAIEDKEAAQVMRSYNLQEKLAQNAGYTIANVLEDAIMALFPTFTQSVGASTTNLADSDIRKAIGMLADNSSNFTEANAGFFVETSVFWNQILALDTFKSRDYTNMLAADGEIRGILYGVPVYVSNRIPYVSSTTGRVNFLATKDAINFATLNLGGGRFRLQSNYIPEYLSTIVTADIVLGVVKARDAAGVKVLSAA